MSAVIIIIRAIDDAAWILAAPELPKISFLHYQEKLALKKSRYGYSLRGSLDISYKLFLSMYYAIQTPKSYIYTVYGSRYIRHIKHASTVSFQYTY